MSSSASFFVFSSASQYVAVAVCSCLLILGTQRTGGDGTDSAKAALSTLAFCLLFYSAMFSVAIVVLTAAVVEKLGMAGVAYCEKHYNGIAKSAYAALITGALLFGLAALSPFSTATSVLGSFVVISTYIGILHLSLAAGSLEHSVHTKLDTNK